jgi:pimeloyl-ACP methyl ester carboxylesterase
MTMIDFAPQARAEPQVTQRVVFQRLTGSPDAAYFLYVPSTFRAGGPMFVSLHGVNRNAAEHAFRFREEAERYGAVLVAPLFEKAFHGGYQQLVSRTGSRSDEALMRIADSVAASTGADGARLHLFGYSGGAQFVHRFAMLHPDRVAVAVIGAAGWYSFPDPSVPYPLGIGASEAFPDLAFDRSAFANTRFVVLVGEKDSRRGKSLRADAEINARQGPDRLERGRRWAAAMAEVGRAHGGDEPARFVLIPNVGHSFSRLASRRRRRKAIFEALGLKPIDTPAVAVDSFNEN